VLHLDNNFPAIAKVRPDIENLPRVARPHHPEAPGEGSSALM
jgi:hypothetical protein